MLRKLVLWNVAVMMVSTPVACRSGDESGEGTKSNFSFTTFLAPSSCLLKLAGEPRIKICISGSGRFDTVKDKSSRALKMWLDALDPVAVDVAKTGLEFNCERPDITLNTWSSGGGGESGGPNQIRIADGSAFGTYLHEFGHAFACLGDTYVGNVAGHCASGQPHSVMCDGLLRNDLSQDDVDGVRHQYAQFLKLRHSQDPAGDADHDGVTNELDLCPSTPAGARVWDDEEQVSWRGCSEGQRPIR